MAWLWRGVGRKARYGTMHRCQDAVVSCMEEVAFLLHVRCTEHVACYLLHAACMMRLARKANGSPWCAQGTNRTEFPCGFSSTAAVRRTCRTLTLMVVPHLPAIVQLHRRVSSPHPSPPLHRVRILPLGPGPQSPSPHSAPAPPHSYPGTGPPVPDQSPHLRISAPRGLGPDPSPQLPRDRAPSPHPRILPRGTRPPPRPPQLPRYRALCLTSDPSPRSFPF